MSAITAPIDFDGIIGDVARELLGEPAKATARVLRYGSSGKLVVRLKGNWSDFAAGVAGGTLSLIEHILGCSRRDAMRWLADRGFIEDRETGELVGSVRAATRPTATIPDDDTPARNETALERARWVWEHSTPARADHPYLIAKGITPEGLPIRDYRGSLVVALQNAAGAFVGLQYIGADGSKRFNRGISEKKGAFALVGTDDGTGRVFTEGLATAATVHAATGKQCVVALDAGNLPIVAREIRRENDSIAADHDSAPKPGERWNKPFSAYGTGHKSALKCVLPVYLPDAPGLDFNDTGTERTRAIFEQPPISETPAFDAWKLTRIPGKANELLAALSAESDPKQAAELAYSAAAAMARKAPIDMSLIEIRCELDRAARLHPSTLDSIIERLESSQDYRKQAALAAVSIPAHASRPHRVERPPELPAIKEWKGVIIIRAPMGAGKTQRVGRPLADYAAAQNALFLAITPRQSLTTESAVRIGTEDYAKLTREAAKDAPNLSTCLPSITNPNHAPVIDSARFVFIDEISQVLRFLASAAHCRTSAANNAGVYAKLVQIVRNAECVVVADAGVDARTIAFLEHCRPGERFRIIDVPVRDKGNQAAFRTKAAGLHTTISNALAELENGGKVWLSCESKKRVKQLGELFRSAGYDPLVIHADNDGEPAQAAFLADADRESRKYRIVISSPTISSGISIEHRDAKPNERFTMGCYIGGGYASTPADAMQQMGRVRYLKRWELALLPNNLPGSQHAEAIIGGAMAAAYTEDTVARVTGFDHFVANIRADDDNSRADFAAGLLWQLSAAGWHITRDSAEQDDELATKLDNARDGADRRWRDMIIAAPRISDSDAQELERATLRSELQSATLEAHRVRRGLGLALMPINDAVLDVWADGSVRTKLDNFNASSGLVPQSTDGDELLTTRRFHVARARSYKRLFNGIDILARDAITPDVAETVLDRIMDQRQLLAAIGIVGPKYRQHREDRRGNEIPMPRPKYAVREVADLLERMGLSIAATKEITAKDVADDASRYTETPPSATPSAPKKRRKSRLYSVTDDSLALTVLWADKRAAAQDLVPLSPPIKREDRAEIAHYVPDPTTAVPLPEPYDDDIPLPCAGPPASWERSVDA